MTETKEKKIKPVLASLDRALACARLADEKKAENIRILDISRISSIADYLVIVSGGSDKQNQAIADAVRTGLKKFGKVIDIEGERDGKWIVMDYGDVLVHIFHESLRGYYDLDGLWAAAEEIPFTQ